MSGNVTEQVIMILIAVLVFGGIFYAVLTVTWQLLKARDRAKRTVAFCQWVESQRVARKEERHVVRKEGLHA